MDQIARERQINKEGLRNFKNLRKAGQRGMRVQKSKEKKMVVAIVSERGKKEKKNWLYRSYRVGRPF
jgi:hypothetical protein